MTIVSLTSAPATTLDVDALIIGITAEARKHVDGPPALPDDVRREVDRMLEQVGASGKLGEITRIPSEGLVRAPMIVAVGLGDMRILDTEKVRRTAGAAVRSLAGLRSAGIVVTSPDAPRIEAIVTGALLGNYAFHDFRGVSAGAQSAPLERILITGSPRDAEQRAALERARIVSEAVCLARDLVNTPPSALSPEDVAHAAIDAVDRLPVRVEVWDETGLAELGCGGILGVGQGSANAPRLVRLEYSPRGARRTLAIVGKGITFDTGGISIKPAQNMDHMKADMSGAAAVIAAMNAIARLRLPVRVVGWVPTAENMPGGRAQRPGDILTTYGGHTVEVLNTDAEGRLILADALEMAAEESPDLIVDAATLTGAQSVALGKRTSGVMGRPDAARDGVWEASRRAGELMWPMPIPEELRPSLDSPVADIANIGERMGGMMTGAAFLADFVPEDIPWVHLDIAGPAYNDGSSYGYTPKGGTGAAVRTFIQVATDMAEGTLP